MPSWGRGTRWSKCHSVLCWWVARRQKTTQKSWRHWRESYPCYWWKPSSSTSRRACGRRSNTYSRKQVSKDACSTSHRHVKTIWLNTAYQANGDFNSLLWKTFTLQLLPAEDIAEAFKHIKKKKATEMTNNYFVYCALIDKIMLLSSYAFFM